MVKPVLKRTNSPHTDNPDYQQALDNFGITELMQRLSQLALKSLDFEEIESMAALLIQQLTNSLNSQLIGNYLNAIRNRHRNVISDLPLLSRKFQASIDSPNNLSDRLPPNYEVGDRVCWIPISEETDVGMIIGRFLTPAPHQGGKWTWQYLIKLEKNSPSSRWVVADIAFEEDLEPVALEVSR